MSMGLNGVFLKKIVNSIPGTYDGSIVTFIAKFTKFNVVTGRGFPEVPVNSPSRFKRLPAVSTPLRSI